MILSFLLHEFFSLGYEITYLSYKGVKYVYKWYNDNQIEEETIIELNSEQERDILLLEIKDMMKDVQKKLDKLDTLEVKNLTI